MATHAAIKARMVKFFFFLVLWISSIGMIISVGLNFINHKREEEREQIKDAIPKHKLGRFISAVKQNTYIGIDKKTAK